MQRGRVAVFEQSDDHVEGDRGGVYTQSVKIPLFSISALPLALWTSGARQSGATKGVARPERSCVEALSAVGM
jgi:hypothetical protein